MYKQPNARVRVNRVMFNIFKILKGTRLGDLLSPLIFALCTEPLADCIRLEQKIKGIYTAGENQKFSMYADETLIYLSKPEQSIEVLMNVI